MAHVVDPVYFEDTHYLAPDKGGEKPYRLLADAMAAARQQRAEMMLQSCYVLWKQVERRPDWRRKCLICLARPEGFEPPTPRFVVWCSVQLSYGRLAIHSEMTTR